MPRDHSGVELLDESAILALPSGFMNGIHAGIYFLIKEDTIQYIGKSSKNILARVAAHIDNFGPDAFERFCSVQSPHKNILYAEALYIRKFQPPLNASIPDPQSYLPGRKGKKKVQQTKQRKKALMANAKPSGLPVRECCSVVSDILAQRVLSPVVLDDEDAKYVLKKVNKYLKPFDDRVLESSCWTRKPFIDEVMFHMTRPRLWEGQHLMREVRRLHDESYRSRDENR